MLLIKHVIFRRAAGILFCTLWSLPSAQAAPPDLPLAAPEEAGMDGRQLRKIDQLVEQGLQDKKMPGCVVAIGRRGKIVYLKAFGDKQVEPRRIAMTTDTVFDMASITKPAATAMSVMILVDRGKVHLEEPVAKYLPEFGRHDKEKITVVQLLTHQGGLIPDNALKDYKDGPQQAWQRICELKLRAPPGEKFIYTDVGYIVLAKVVEKVSGNTIDVFARQQIFRPLGMNETMYRPGEALRSRAAPTEKRNGQWIQGQVHDPRAFALGGAAGHSGLFSTAKDLAVLAQMMLQKGVYHQVRILSEKTWRKMTSAVKVSRGLRGLGWDMRTGYSSNRGKNFSDQAFGHGGFTGTVLWMDPQLDLFVIFLSNRLHPQGKGLVNRLAGAIGTAAADSILKSP